MVWTTIMFSSNYYKMEAYIVIKGMNSWIKRYMLNIINNFNLFEAIKGKLIENDEYGSGIDCC